MTRKYWTKDFSQIISETEIAEDYAAPAGFVEMEMDFSHRFQHKDTKGVFGQMDANGFSIDYTRLSQRDALEARLDLIDTKKDELNAVINIYRELGGGWQ